MYEKESTLIINDACFYGRRKCSHLASGPSTTPTHSPRMMQQLIQWTGATLVGGTSEIIADPDSAANNLWSYNVNLDAGDELKYSWYPSYWDQNSTENTPVPAPSTIACKFRWVDTTNYFGPDLEIREAYKVQAKIVKKKGLILCLG